MKRIDINRSSTLIALIAAWVLQKQQQRPGSRVNMSCALHASHSRQTETGRRLLVTALQPEAMKPARATASSDDILVKLQQLAQMKQVGILTNEGFAAAKAKVLLD